MRGARGFSGRLGHACTCMGFPHIANRAVVHERPIGNGYHPAGIIGRAISSAPPVPIGAGIARRGRRFVIIEADDLGLLYAFNEGIRTAYADGLLTSTCIRANGYAYEHALAEVLPACPGIGVGIHLCLNEASPVSPPDRVPLLLNRDGRLRPGYLWLMRAARTISGARQIERELRAQIEKVLAGGVVVDHLNSHQHVHMIPSIFRLTCRLAREYGVPCVRLVRELPYSAGGIRKRVQPFTNSNFVKHKLLNAFARANESSARRFGIPTTDYFIGVSYTAHMNLSTIRDGLRASPYGSVEVLLHPAIGPDPRDAGCPDPALKQYVSAPQRAVELAALRVPELAEFLERETWMATNFSTWAKAFNARQPRVIRPELPDAVRQVCHSVVVVGPPWVSAAQDDSRAFAELVCWITPPGARVLDLGTGTGIVAICLARAGKQVVACDVSGAAVRTARANARRNGVRFDCHRSDLLASVPGQYDLIAFNPPYNFGPDTFASNVAKNLLRRVPWVRRNSGLAMPRTVLRFHQRLLERLIEQAPRHLLPAGRIILHAYESEVDALASVLPEGTEVEIIRHPAMGNRTVGMLIRLEGI